MDISLIKMVEREELRGKAKWGHVDTNPGALLNAATEELGEVAHTINHKERPVKTMQEIAECIGVLSRLFEMVVQPDLLTPR